MWKLRVVKNTRSPFARSVYNTYISKKLMRNNTDEW